MIVYAALLQTLLFLPLVFGVGSSWLFLKKADLSPEGSFVLGACVFAQVISSTHSYVCALTLAVIASAFVGICTYLLQISKKITDLLAGLLIIYVLYSVNLIILHKPNFPLFDFIIPFFQIMQSSSEQKALAAIINVLILSALCYALSGKWGLLLKAVGSNPNLVTRLGYSKHKIVFFGYALSSACAGLAGSQVAIISGYSDINMGLGSGILAITTCLIGRSFLELKGKEESYLKLFFQCTLGLYFYFIIMHLVVTYSCPPNYFKLITGSALITALLFQRKKL